MLSTAVQAFFGFFFWVINARLFTTEEVGIATTLISVMALIGTFSSFPIKYRTLFDFYHQQRKEMN